MRISQVFALFSQESLTIPAPTPHARFGPLFGAETAV